MRFNHDDSESSLKSMCWVARSIGIPPLLWILRQIANWEIPELLWEFHQKFRSSDSEIQRSRSSKVEFPSFFSRGFREILQEIGFQNIFGSFIRNSEMEFRVVISDTNFQVGNIRISEVQGRFGSNRSDPLNAFVFQRHPKSDLLYYINLKNPKDPPVLFLVRSPIL